MAYGRLISNSCMSELTLKVGSRSSQGSRSTNEDRFVIDLAQSLFLVADGMGGQEGGELASGMAAELLPVVLSDLLATTQESAEEAVRLALALVNDAIVEASLVQPEGRRMGTTVVMMLHHDDWCYVANLGDSRAHLIRDDQVEQITEDHSVAQAMIASGQLTPEQARDSRYHHVLYRFLGCSDMSDGAGINIFKPRAGDRLLLSSDGLTNHVSNSELVDSAKGHADVQEWANHLVQLSIDNGSRDNVTCVIVAFEER